FAPVRPATGTLVAFAAEPGHVVADGAADLGLYAKYLAVTMRVPGLSLEQVFKRVREGVESESAGRQVPVEFSTLPGRVFCSQKMRRARRVRLAGMDFSAAGV